LNARGEKRAQRAADGDGRKGLTMSFDRQQYGRKTACNKDERAKSVIPEIVFHDVSRDLDDRGGAL
jgi:hypothetical protein